MTLLHDKPRIEREEAVWLTADEAGALLDAAYAYDAREGANRTIAGAPGVPLTCFGPLLATFLLTGGRKQEVLGLRRVDVDWTSEVVRIVPYEGRALKRGDGRAVPLWEQLADLLRAYLRDTEAHVSGLLFPSPVPHRAHLGHPAARWRLYNLRKPLAWAVARSGLDKAVTLHTLRHTYCAARLQTYHLGPQGQAVQVGVYQVARELGHRSSSMVEHIYSHVAPRPDRLQAQVCYPTNVRGVERDNPSVRIGTVTMGVTGGTLGSTRSSLKSL